MELTRPVSSAADPTSDRTYANRHSDGALSATRAGIFQFSVAADQKILRQRVFARSIQRVDQRIFRPSLATPHIVRSRGTDHDHIAILQALLQRGFSASFLSISRCLKERGIGDESNQRS